MRRSAAAVRYWLAIALAIAATAGCAKKTATAPPPAGAGSPGGSLAYQHTVTIALDAALIADRIAGTRTACGDGRFGA